MKLVELNLNEFNNEIFVIGGGSIYKQFFPIVDYLYITKVHTTFSNADTFFPILNDEWELVHQENYKKNNDNEYDYSYLEYKKSKK